MFTGLIEATGTVLALEKQNGGAARLTIAAPSLEGRWRRGDSIAVSGVCLTAIPVADASDRFAADLAEETMERTTLSRLAPGAVVNLELPTPAGSPLGGHVVQGHVDATGRIIVLTPLSADRDTTDWRLTLEIPAELAPRVVSQGSLTVNGISLTVAKLHESAPDGTLTVEIAIIPHTYKATNLHTLGPGSEVNLETDVLARYAAQQAAVRIEHTALTVESLIANGY
jgi:riboflavin synthase